MDQHLNLFYSYNQDNELIENNLTRAFIITLRLLSPGIKHRLLHNLLHKHLVRLGSTEITFHDTQFALQNHIDINRVFQTTERYLVTLASDRIIMAEEEGQKDWSSMLYLSIPDGWIFDYQAGWCFLIESKVGTNPLNNQQLISHAVKWLGINTTQLPSHLISLSWLNIISAIQEIESVTDSNLLNQQEILLLSHFKDFIGYYGYRKFEGIIWTDLKLPPKFNLRKHRVGKIHRKGFLQFSDLLSTPFFTLSR